MFKPRSTRSEAALRSRRYLGAKLPRAGEAQAHPLTLESQELGTIAVDCGGQCGPACQILEGGHSWKAGGASGHSSVLAVSNLWVGAGLGQR